MDLPPRHDEPKRKRNRRRVSGGRRSHDRLDAHLVALIEYADDAIIGTTPDGRIESWNPAAERIFGHTADEIVGKPGTVLVPRERYGEERKILAHILAGATVDHYETVRLRKDGGKVTVSLTVSPIKDLHGRVIGTSQIARDVTESRRAEQRLRDSEARYRELFESSRDAILCSDMEGRLTDANRAATEMLGYTLAELRRLTYQQLTPARWHDMERTIVREQMLQRGYSDAYEKEYLRKDGTVVPISVRAWLIKTRNEQPSGMWVLVRDITERQRVDKALHENQARWQSLFENAPVAIWEEDFSAVRARFTALRDQGITDLRHYLHKHPEETRHLAGLVNVLDMSHATLATFGAANFTEVSRSLPDYFDDESLAVFREEMVALWSGQRCFSAEIPIRDATGRHRLLDVRLSVLPGFERTLARVLVSFLDITERRQSEEALRESEQRFRGLAEAMPHVVWETDAAGRTLYQNKVWYDYIGRGPETSPGIDWLHDLHPDDRNHVLAEWTESIRTEGAHLYDVEARIRRHDGTYRWFRAKGAPIRNAAGKVTRWAGTCTDIDDQKRAAERLEFAQMAGAVGFFDYYFAADRSTWTEGLARLYGVDLKRLQGTWDTWAKRVVPQDAAAVRAAVDRHIREHADSMDCEFRVVLPDTTQRWLAARARLIYDQAGKPARMTGMQVDISEIKGLEQKLKERAQQLVAADRRKDEFLATLAHELRNPLAPIRTSVDIIRLHAGGNPRLQWAGDAIARQVQHLDHLVADLLDLARIAQGKIRLNLEPSDLRIIVERAVEMNRDAIKAKRQQLIVQSPAGGLPLHGDVARLIQVVSNLINNAVKYTPPGGAIRIAAARENGTVALRVQDSGPGIKPDLLPYVFDLFVQGERTLERAEGGLGIGLTLVKRITELHGGQVSAASRGPDHGTEFIVRLPLAPAGVPGSERRTERGVHRKTATPKRILIVEDNRDAADSLAFLLTDLGHDVIVVYDGSEGMEKAFAHRPDVAILDIGLPGVTGYELARRLRQEPRLRNTLLIALSGYGQAADREESRAAGFDYHMIKPANLNSLNAIIARGRTAH